GSYGVTNSTAAATATAQTLNTAVANTFSIDMDAAGVLTGVDVTINPGAGAATYDAAVAGEAKRLETDINSALQTALNPIYGAGSVPFTAKVTQAGVGAAARFTTTFTSSNPSQTFTVDISGADATAATLGITAHTSTIAGSGGTFQVGSGTSTSDQISITIGAMGSTALGLGNVDVSVGTLAVNNANITAIDSAITQVSTLRGNLGAFQNRFEHTISNLSVTTENLSASESRIRDTDMASEMMSFTRAQILQQAGTAMRAQANAVPQTVLQLLK
ncbi:MAG: flagellin, partial [Actinomycetia bacterium]|nr:flagellin [Actinomycetes bacterium]